MKHLSKTLLVLTVIIAASCNNEGVNAGKTLRNTTSAKVATCCTGNPPSRFTIKANQMSVAPANPVEKN